MTPRFLAAVLGAAALFLALPACKPPPTDAAVARVSLLAPASGPSAPLPSPDVKGAVWAVSGANGSDTARLVYGVPGQPVLLALECLDPATPEARLRITRHAPADEGAAALLALIGNGRIARFEVDSTPHGGQSLWQGEIPAIAPGWDALGGLREGTATVPGAGLVRLNPSPLPMGLVSACRGPATKAGPETAKVPLSPEPPADPA